MFAEWLKRRELGRALLAMPVKHPVVTDAESAAIMASIGEEAFREAQRLLLNASGYVRWDDDFKGE